MKKIIGLWLLALVIGFGVVGIANAGLDKEIKYRCTTLSKQVVEYAGMTKTAEMSKTCEQL